MNRDILMLLRNTLAQVKDEYNFCIFYIKLGKKISTNVSHAAGNLLIHQILCKLSLIGKNVPNLVDGAKCFDYIWNKPIIHINLNQELQNK